MLTILTANQKGGCGKTSISLTLAVALAHEGYKVAIADADLQKSALRFLKYRPDDVTPIMGIDWRDSDDIGDLTKKIDKAKPDVLIIDAPGAVAGKRAEWLIGECDLMFVPVLPSFFDIDSTKRFFKEHRRHQASQKRQSGRSSHRQPHTSTTHGWGRAKRQTVGDI